MSEGADVDRLTAIKELLDYCIRKPDTQYAYSRCRICDQSFWDREEHRFGCKLLEWREALRDQSLSQEAVRDEALARVLDAAWALSAFIKHHDYPAVGSSDFNELMRLADAQDTALRALKREPNAAAPGASDD